jgi:hypothetical protein
LYRIWKSQVIKGTVDANTSVKIDLFTSCTVMKCTYAYDLFR